MGHETRHSRRYGFRFRTLIKRQVNRIDIVTVSRNVCDRSAGPEIFIISRAECQCAPGHRAAYRAHRRAARRYLNAFPKSFSPGSRAIARSLPRGDRSNYCARDFSPGFQLCVCARVAAVSGRVRK